MTHTQIVQDHDLYLTYLCYPEGKPPLSDANSLGWALFRELWDEWLYPALSQPRGGTNDKPGIVGQGGQGG